jgi:hypothetical protein
MECARRSRAEVLARAGGLRRAHPGISLPSTRIERLSSSRRVRLRGRSPHGARLTSDVSQGQWRTMTFVAALRHNKMVAPMVVDGSMNGEIFLAYVEQCLSPTLKRNDIVVMDTVTTTPIIPVCLRFDRSRLAKG